jgi:hypothetical protein
MSQHSRPQVRALRASRGLPGYEGDCHGPRRRPAPTRRARRAHNRAWPCWALARGRPPHREERAGVRRAPSRLRPVPGAGSSRARAAPTPLVLRPPPRGVHIGRVPRPRAPRGARGAPHGPPRSSATPRGQSTCGPGRGEGLYVPPRPAQPRLARSARAWWACSGLPLGPRGWYPADSSARPGVVGAEALRRAWVALLRAWGTSVGCQGGWKARFAFWRASPNLLLQGSVLEGGCAVLGLTARYAAS